jgi:hypothetical protein
MNKGPGYESTQVYPPYFDKGLQIHVREKIASSRKAVGKSG